MAVWILKTIRETKLDQGALLLLKSGGHFHNPHFEANRIYINGLQFTASFGTYSDQIRDRLCNSVRASTPHGWKLLHSE
jgi:hypothetical protein